MEYIILDNEWNTTFKKINGKCFNELIEIGAVKLDENLKEISRFSVLIRSTFTKKLSSRFQRLTNITTEEMRTKGMTFEQAISLYIIAYLISFVIFQTRRCRPCAFRAG